MGKTYTDFSQLSKGVFKKSAPAEEIKPRPKTNAVGGNDVLSFFGLDAPETPTGASGGESVGRILTSTYTAGDIVRTTTYLYNGLGEQVGTILDGITNRTDVTYAQISNEWWKVETTVVVGPSTNSLTIVRTQLTGLSDACRRHTVTITGTTDILSVENGGTGTTGVSPVAGATTETLVTYDPATGIENETVTSSIGPTVIRRSLHGVLLSTETTGETTYNSYDAFARIAQTWRAAVSAATGTTGVSPVASYDYSSCGDLLATHTYTNGDEVVTESYAYDMLGNRIATTDALDNTIYGVFGRKVANV